MEKADDDEEEEENKTIAAHALQNDVKHYVGNPLIIRFSVVNYCILRHMQCMY